MDGGAGVAVPEDDAIVTEQTAERWEQVKRLFTAALEQSPPARSTFLAASCKDDSGLRGEVDALLAAHENAGSFLKSITPPGKPQTSEAMGRFIDGSRIGPYEIVGFLGAGGMGQVYRARDARLGREVAIKVLPAGVLEESAVRRFEVEARAAGSLNHPNIIAVYDVGTHDGIPYLVCELVEGQTLRERLDKPLAMSTAIDLALQFAQGLSAAHDRGVVHRDLKPENLFVTNEGRLKILDFGLARLVHEDSARKPVTRAGTVMGTVGYMSPEQVRGLPVDHRSDIFSFGLILHELLTGKPAFERPSAAEISAAIVNDPPPVLPRDLPSALVQLVSRCLEKDPARRFQSARELASELERMDSKAEPRSLIGELKRRRVFRVLIGYGVVSFAVLQVIEPIMHGLGLPDSVLKVVVVLLGLGFPIALILAWAFDVNAGRIEKTPAAPRAGLRGARLALLLVAVGLLAAAPGIFWVFLRQPAAKPKVAEVPIATEALRLMPSIAVLPFADMSPQKDQEYFSDGIAEEILNALAHVEGLHVTGRTSSFYFKGKTEDLRSIGAKLNVAHVLEGSVRKAGNRVRITAQIINVSDGYHLWSETFDRELTDIFAVQDQIAQAVATALKLKLLPAAGHRPAGNVEAYNQYLLGKRFAALYSTDDAQRAIEALEKSLALDPGYAPAWAELAGPIVIRVFAAPSTAERNRWLQRGLAAAEKAIALDPALSEGYSARAFMRETNWEWAGARADVERALALNPGDVYTLNIQGRLLGYLGQLPEAIRTFQKATSVDPLSSWAWFELSGMYLNAGQLELARSALDRASEINPEDKDSTTLGIALLLEGKPADALASFQRAGGVHVRSTKDTAILGFRYHEGIALAEHDLGHPKESQAALDELIAGWPDTGATAIASVYAWRGEPDRAFEWLDRAFQTHQPRLSTVKINPLLRNLRSDARYRALLGKMHLPLD